MDDLSVVVVRNPREQRVAVHHICDRLSIPNGLLWTQRLKLLHSISIHGFGRQVVACTSEHIGPSTNDELKVVERLLEASARTTYVEHSVLQGTLSYQYAAGRRVVCTATNPATAACRRTLSQSACLSISFAARFSSHLIVAPTTAVRRCCRRLDGIA